MRRFLMLLSFVAVMGITTLLPTAVSAQSSAVPADFRFEVDIPVQPRDNRAYRGRGQLRCRWIEGHWTRGRDREWVWVNGYRKCWRDNRGRDRGRNWDNE